MRLPGACTDRAAFVVSDAQPHCTVSPSGELAAGQKNVDRRIVKV